jgi:lipopolysaccharide cholinephosphotransferase
MKKLFLITKRISGILLITLSIYLYWTEVHDRDWQYVNVSDEKLKKYYTDKEFILNLYQLTKDFHDIATKHKLRYWIEGGTLLGAVRNQGIIKFDDDVDVDIMHEDEIHFQSLIHEFEKLGYNVRHNNIYSICCNKKPPCLDIFIRHRTKDDTVLHTNLTMRTKFKNEFFLYTELFPLKKYKFGEMELYGPNNPKPHLDRAYPEWDKYAVIHQKHNNSFYLFGVHKVKFALTPEILKPAEPKGPLQNRVSFD